ncbi:cytochrome P450 [Xylariaceae sp. FL0594]|nr:cytochrome P450 [Xylariaceae sp. FL0594]
MPSARSLCSDWGPTQHFRYTFLPLAGESGYSRSVDAHEPPAVETTVPFLGPLFGLLTRKTQYYVALRDKFHLPIYTLRLPFSRIYVLSSPDLIPAVQKQWRTLNFSPFSAGAGRVLGMSKESLKTMHEGIADNDGYAASWVRRMATVLGPGEDLDAINRRSIELFVDDLRTLSDSDSRRYGLWDWVRESIVKATSESIYGPQNPLRDPKIKEAWKTFEGNFLTLAISPLPSLLCRKGLQAREMLAKAMIEYMKNGGYKTGSALVQMRHDVHVSEYNFSIEDVGRGEIGNTFAVLGNTTPAAWWFIYHLFSDPSVLADIRHELEACVQVDSDSNTHSIDLACIRTSCPVLLSTFQEVLRFRALNAGPRVVMQNVTYAPGKKGQTRVAFRAFGGGHVLCPGRHFASTEIMALGALLALQFDVKPVAGRWTETRCDKSPLASGFPVPDHDIPVDFRVRFPERKWRVSFTGSKEAMGIVSEDVA